MPRRFPVQSSGVRSIMARESDRSPGIPVKILFATSETQPLIKTGGLADVSGSLPAALNRLGEDVRLVLPAYRGVAEAAGALEKVAELELPGATRPVRVLEGRVPESGVHLYLVDSQRHFDRPGAPYTTADGSDWPDNAQRFALFARAVRALAQDRASLGWAPDVVHANDWQCGLVPALLSRDPRRPATVFTIHNLSYQGLFPWSTFQDLDLPYDFWSLHAMEFHGKFSFLKGGLVFADRLTTVSPTYAREICTAQFGYGLEGLLQHRRDVLYGILNGVDYSAWDPQHDKLIPWNYSSSTLCDKVLNKAPLLDRFGLEEQPNTPVIAMVSRLVEQKGIDLVLAILDQLMDQPLQLVILGTGTKPFEDALREAARRHDGLGVHVGYDEELAHMIEAGADMFLMPSRFEPCGLNQMYSLRYGTVPIVRRTGGLADTVIDADSAHRRDATATGFVFDEPTPQALYHAIERALLLYENAPAWLNLMHSGMRHDYSWERSAASYLDLYSDATATSAAAAP